MTCGQSILPSWGSVGAGEADALIPLLHVATSSVGAGEADALIPLPHVATSSVGAGEADALIPLPRVATRQFCPTRHTGSGNGNDVYIQQAVISGTDDR